jgi:hypothetical protein
MALHYASRRRDGTLEIRLPEELRRILRHLMRQLDALLDSGGDASDREPDPLEAITGMGPGLEARPRPDDPALLRLRPDAYRSDVDGGEAAREYRRFTESELEGIQRARVAVVLDGLAEGDRVPLGPEEAEAWLGALNDCRLALGSRLGIDHDDWDGTDADQGTLFQYAVVTEVFHDLLRLLT